MRRRTIARALLAALSAGGVLLGGAFLGGAGCVKIADPTRIEDLRILEVRADPPEIAVFAPSPPARGFADLVALPRRRSPVTLGALVVHPDLDARFQHQWYRCKPNFQALPCDSGEFDPLIAATTASVATVSPVDLIFADSATAAGEGGFAGALATLASNPRDLLNGFYAYVDLRVTIDRAAVHVDTRQLDATKRVVIFDPQLVRAAILEARRGGARLGADAPGGSIPLPGLCTDLTDDALQLLLEFLASRTPNRAPVYADLEVEGPGAAPARSLSPGVPLVLHPGERVTFRAHAAPGDKERYALIDDNCQLQPLIEVLSWSWSATAGSLSSRLTTESVEDEAMDSSRHKTAYTAPGAAAPAAGTTRARIYSILRDGRGGSAARIIDVEVAP